VPNVDEEDLRRSHRERDRLVRERTAHINRIKGLLFGQGIRGINVKSKYKTLQIDKLITGDERPLPPRLASEITREIARLALIQEQIATFERERDHAPTPCKATEKKRLRSRVAHADVRERIASAGRPLREVGDVECRLRYRYRQLALRKKGTLTMFARFCF